MKHRALSLASALLSLLAPRVGWAQSAESEAPTVTPLQLGLFTPLRLLPFSRPHVTGLSIGVFQSTTYGVDGIEVSGLYNVTHGAMRGLQLSPIVNTVDTDCFGVMASAVNVCGQNGAGIFRPALAGPPDRRGQHRDRQRTAVLSSDQHRAVGHPR